MLAELPVLIRGGSADLTFAMPGQWVYVDCRNCGAPTTRFRMHKSLKSSATLEVEGECRRCRPGGKTRAVVALRGGRLTMVTTFLPRQAQGKGNHHA